MKDRYTYTDFEGAEVSVYPWPRDDRVGSVISWDHSHDGVLIAPDRLDEFVTELYKAVGKPAPVVIERPEIIPNGRVRVGSMRVETHGSDVKLVASENNWYLIQDPPALAAALMTVHERIRASEVSEFASFLFDVWDSDTTVMAREILARFKVEERSS